MRVLLASRSDDAKLAIDVYAGAVVQAIAAMAACIGGIDALVFSGGIGAHAGSIRQRIVDDLAWFGLRTSGAELDATGEPSWQVFAMDVDEETELVMQWRLAQASDTPTSP